MMQYYNGYKTGGLSTITNNNRDNINVKYVNLSSAKDCWIMERRLQVIAYDQGEKCLGKQKLEISVIASVDLIGELRFFMGIIALKYH